MINFDPTSIYNRILEKLQQDPNWKIVSNNSVISALIKSNAEINAETARYAEYLFKESKWDTAQNASSILSMANILGYHPKRKRSAVGTIYVSADSRAHLVGKTISSAAFLNKNIAWKQPSTDLNITSDCTIIDSKGNNYVALPAYFSKSSKYIKLDIVQGIKRTITVDINTIRATATSSKLDPYLYIPVKIYNCEDAGTTSTRPFFRVFVDYNNSTSDYAPEYRVVDSLLFSDNTDQDVEVYNDIYNRDLFYLKFNNDPARGNTLDISESNTSISQIRIEYIESLGSRGNVTDLFENFTITGVIAPDNTSRVKLYGVNFDIIANGKEEETVLDIKRNAPMHYIANYTAGTKEAYIQTVQNIEFPVGSKQVRPNRVQVYGNKTVDKLGNVTPITCISFIAPGLEDLASNITYKGQNPYESIENALNYNLMRLKSPQDTLKFIPPNFVTYALGVTCKVDRKHVADIHQLESDIRNFIDSHYGSESTDNDFGRNIYPTQIEADIKNKFGKSVIAPVVELEAIKRINWFESTRMAPRASEDASGSSQTIRTIRVPFSFNPVFLGKLTPKGFKDYKVSAGYVMRIDIMYKKPKVLAQSMNFHTSIFVEDSATLRTFKVTTVDEDTGEEIVSTQDTRPFYLRKDSQEPTIWPATFEKTDDSYKFLNSISKLPLSQQFYFKDYMLTDNDYRNLISNDTNASSTAISSHKISPGAIDDYMIYFSADYDLDDDEDSIGEGWLEFTFDPLYDTLLLFSKYDTQDSNSQESLANRLTKCSLATLKCGNDKEALDEFLEFQKILNDYVDIYVCMRPYDPQLVVNSVSTKNNENTVLYIDSQDALSAQSSRTINLTPFKKPRMISVRCEYEE